MNKAHFTRTTKAVGIAFGGVLKLFPITVLRSTAFVPKKFWHVVLLCVRSISSAIG